MAESNATSSSPGWARNVLAGAALACILSSGLALYGHSLAPSASAPAMRSWSTVLGIPDSRAAALPVSSLSADAGLLPLTDANTLKYRAIGDYLARRYRVSSSVTTDIVAHAYAAGRQYSVDPLLILAVISVESSFNPIAESTMGAKGLMQVMPQYHAEKFMPLGGERTVFEPQANIQVGAQILKEYIHRTGDMDDALKLYVGASTDKSENGYAAKVMAERQRLYQVLYRYQAHRQQLAQL